jgi:hypothetical protein
MSLLDKAKASMQQVAQQGQAKVHSIQQSRSEAEMYRALGEAFYNQQRRGGDPTATESALQALDVHFQSLAAEAQTTSAVPPADTPPPQPGPSDSMQGGAATESPLPPSGTGSVPGTGAPPGPATTPGAPAAGTFNLDNP